MQQAGHRQDIRATDEATRHNNALRHFQDLMLRQDDNGLKKR